MRCRLCCRGDTLRFRARIRRDTLRLGLCLRPRFRIYALSLCLCCACAALRVRPRRSCNAICISLRICGDLLCPRCRVLDESGCLVAGNTGRCGGCACRRCLRCLFDCVRSVAQFVRQSYSFLFIHHHHEHVILWSQRLLTSFPLKGHASPHFQRRCARRARITCCACCRVLHSRHALSWYSQPGNFFLACSRRHD